MKTTTKRGCLLSFIFLLLTGLNGVFAADSAVRLSNDRYTVDYDLAAHTFEVKEKSSGRSRVFTPVFQVVYRSAKPSATMTSINTNEDFEFKVVGYKGDLSLFSANAGAFATCTPVSASLVGNTIEVDYPATADFRLQSVISLPQGNEEPVIESSMTSLKTGYYSVGYYGAPELNRNEISELFQPLPWTGLRVPADSYLTPAFLSTMPGTFLTVGPITYGVYADPSEFPFDPLPCSLARSPFGVALRNQVGKGKELKPMVWSPIMGNGDSYCSANQTKKFKIRTYVSQSTLSTAYEDIARRSFGFGNFRNNDLGSINKTMHRMIDYALSTQWGVFKEDMKGSSYDTDVAGSVKNTSALPPFAIAYVADNEEVFEKRAMPVLEFMLSRENTMFAYDEVGGAGGQTATNSLGKPCMNVSEMLSFYNLTDKRMNALLEIASINRKSAVASHEIALKENFSFYRATGQANYLNNLVAGANKYIDEEITQKPTDFQYVNHSKSSFWSQIAPKFVELYEVYKTTGDVSYLTAARQAARTYAYHLWMAPRFNMGDSVLCNKGGKAPRYRGSGQISIAEEKAPAWRLSEMGLQCEAGGTSTSGHRGIFAANYAAYLLRIGEAAQDTFLLDIGKAAVIGRYTNFPGYHINTDRTTVYEKWNFPLRTLEQLTSTSMHYSHIWTQINLMLDYLVSDVAVRTHGAVDFPGQYVQNIVHMQNQVYTQGGEFYGQKGLSLYMPKDFVSTTSKQLNFLSAYGNGKLYIVFTNQSNEPVETDATIDPSCLTLDGNPFAAWEENVSVPGGVVASNRFSFKIAPNGVTAVAIDGVTVKPKFQQKMAVNTKHNSWNTYYQDNITAGKSKAILINPSDSLTRLFVFSTASAGTLSSYRIDYSIDGGEWKSETDTKYPFEFTIQMDNVSSIEYKLSAGGVVSPVYRIERARPTGVLSGWNSVRRAQGADLNIELSGVAPFSIQYCENDKLHTVDNIAASPYLLHVTPDYNTCYRLYSVTAGDGTEGNASGDAKVVVLDGYDTDRKVSVSADAHVYSAQPAKNFGTQPEMELKGSPANRRDLYLSCDLTAVSLSASERAVLGLWLNSTSRLDEVGNELHLVVSVLEGLIDEQSVSWNSRPDESRIVRLDTVAITASTPMGGYIYLDVTSAVREGARGVATFKVEFLKGQEVASLYFASKENGEPSKTPHVAVVTEAAVSLLQTGDTDNVTIRPTAVDEWFEVLSPTAPQAITVINNLGQVIVRVSGDTTRIEMKAWAPGVYYVIVKCAGGKEYRKTIIKI